jgi:hypothetical protein
VATDIYYSMSGTIGNCENMAETNRELAKIWNPAASHVLEERIASSIIMNFGHFRRSRGCRKGWITSWRSSWRYIRHLRRIVMKFRSTRSKERKTW